MDEAQMLEKNFPLLLVLSVLRVVRIKSLPFSSTAQQQIYTKGKRAFLGDCW